MDCVMINQLPELAIARNRTFAPANNMTVATSVITEKRNPYVTKWYVLFDNKNDQWISFQPQAGHVVYPCYACRDMFGSRSSFLDHVNRRGLICKYKCPNCKQQKIFYNTCSFLLHCRDHFPEVGGQIDFDNVDISTIPMHIAGFLPIPNIPLLYNSEDDTVNSNLNISVKFYKPTDDCLGKRFVNFLPNDLIFFCSLNNNPVTSNVALMLKQVNSTIPKCIFISVASTNNNISDNTSNINNVMLDDPDVICLDEDDDSHITNEDIKPEIRVKNLNALLNNPNLSSNGSQPPIKESERCLFCSECNTPQFIMAKHFLEIIQPIADKYKCSKCGLISTSSCALSAHMRIHDKKPPFVCPECGDKFESWDELDHHMEDICFHTAKSVRYKCPAKKCGKVFAQNVTFSSHFPVAHMKVRFACNKCSEHFANEVEFGVHAPTHDQNTKTFYVRIHVCTVCSSPTKDIKRHVLNHVNDKDNRVYVYICRYCRSCYRSKQTYATHILKCTKLLLNNQVKKEVQRSESQSDAKYAFETSPNSDDSNKRKRKRLLNGSFKNKSPEKTIEDIVLPVTPEPFDGEYKCKLCDFKNESRKSFHEHIQQHRDISTSYQCMECGECFVVKPSLIKHLQVFHLVEDFDCYMNENECFDKEAVRMLEENMRMVPGEGTELVAENQCRICRQIFPDAQELSKHFRTHGMAFLMKKIIK